MNVNWLYLPWDQVIKCDEALLEGQRGVNKEGTERGGVKGGGEQRKDAVRWEKTL